jgi:hypothetical protein
MAWATFGRFFFTNTSGHPVRNKSGQNAIQFVWWSICIRHSHFIEFVKRYRLSVITVFGATSGGITSIGGGVIAFPVMTLGFTIPPPIARDFCIMCQAVGNANFKIVLF